MTVTESVDITTCYQNSVWIIRIFSITPRSVDSWEAAVRSHLAIHAPSHYLIYDLTAVTHPGITLYMNKRVSALAQDNRSATGRVAISLPLSSTVRYIFEPFIRLNSIRLQPYLNVKLFADTEEGIGWVIESLPPEIRGAGR